MKEKFQKAIEEVRTNAKCKRITIVCPNYVFKMINDLKLENVDIVTINMFGGKYQNLFDDGKVYIFPNFKEDPVYLNWN